MTHLDNLAYPLHCTLSWPAADEPRDNTELLPRYADLTECMHGISLEELIMAVRRQSQGFSRGTSTFRGVTHHPSGAACISQTDCPLASPHFRSG